MDIDELIQQIKGNEGDSPVYDVMYLGPTCKNCGLSIATEAAWNDLEDEDGTNLCWSECEANPDTTITRADALQLIVEIERLRAENVRWEYWAEHGRWPEDEEEE